MNKKRFETICGIVCFTGFVYLIGTVGAMEHDTITLGRGILQSITGLVVFAGAAFIGGFIG